MTLSGRDRKLLVLLGLLGALAALWYFALQPKREEAARLADDIAQAEQRLDAARAETARARAAQATFKRDKAVVARLGLAVPPGASVPELVDQLETAAHRARIDFRAVKLRPAAATAAAAPAPAAGADGKSAAPAAGGPAAPATQAAAATLPAGAAVGAAGLATMPFTFTFEGSFAGLESFLQRVGRFVAPAGDRLGVSGRLLTVDGLTLAAAASGFPRVKATLSATAYLLPATADGSAAPSAASAASGAAPSSPKGGPGTPPAAPATATPGIR